MRFRRPEREPGQAEVIPGQRAVLPSAAAPPGWQMPICRRCGGPNISESELRYSTGVYAPDGGEEWGSDRGCSCADCGALEDSPDYVFVPANANGEVAKGFLLAAFWFCLTLYLLVLLALFGRGVYLVARWVFNN